MDRGSTQESQKGPFIHPGQGDVSRFGRRLLLLIQSPQSFYCLVIGIIPRATCDLEVGMGESARNAWLESSTWISKSITLMMSLSENQDVRSPPPVLTRALFERCGFLPKSSCSFLICACSPPSPTTGVEDFNSLTILLHLVTFSALLLLLKARDV